MGASNSKDDAAARGDDNDDDGDLHDADPGQMVEPPPPPPGYEYALRGPSRQGIVTPCFRSGSLFRVVDGRRGLWSYYNDTTKYEMHVRGRFGPDSDLRPLGATTKSRMDDGWIVLCCVVYPGETVPFFRGSFKAFSSEIAAKPLSSAYRERLNLATEVEVQRGLDAVIQLAHGRTQLEPILASCVLQQVPFVDTSFPPNAASLQASVGTQQDADDENGALNRVVMLPRTAWHRPRAFQMTQAARGPGNKGASQSPKTQLQNQQGAPTVAVTTPAGDGHNSKTAAGSAKATPRQIPSGPAAAPTSTSASAVESSDPNEEPGVFLSSASPTDIEPGELGDAALLSAAAALAETPKRIQVLFQAPPGGDALQSRREQGVGAYRVTLNRDGWWESTILDDYIPCVGGVPCFGRNKSNPRELWVCMLEKAYAKAHGGYAAIVGGDVMLALADLTGFPGHRVDARWPSVETVNALAARTPLRTGAVGAPRTPLLQRAASSAEVAETSLIDNAIELFFSLAGAVHSGHVVVLNTPSATSLTAFRMHGVTTETRLEENFDNAGLRLSQGYAIIDTKTFPALGLYLLRIRNPWSTREWSGDWSDGSKSWSNFPGVATACGFRPVDDGTFWMDWCDAVRYFDGAAVCSVHDDLRHDYRVQAAFENGFPTVALEVTVTGTVPVSAQMTICQKDRRNARRGSPDTKYSAVMLSVCRPHPTKGDRLEVHRTSSEDPSRPTDGYNFLYGRDVSVLYRFEPSTRPYLVVPRAYDAGSMKNFVLSFVADRLVDGTTVQVAFRRISPSCTVFSNYNVFHYGASYGSAHEATFQYRDAHDGVPCSGRGYEFRTERSPGVPQIPPGRSGAAPLASIGPAAADGVAKPRAKQHERL